MTNLSGAILESSVPLEAVSGGPSGSNLFCDDSGQNRLGMWDDTMSSLKLKLCQEQTMHVGQQYAFSFVVTNPQHDQESPRIMIEASGDFVNMLPAPLVKSDAAILGI